MVSICPAEQWPGFNLTAQKVSKKEKSTDYVCHITVGTLMVMFTIFFLIGTYLTLLSFPSYHPLPRDYQKISLDKARLLVLKQQR